jgi:protein-disulfide isomerase
MRLMPIRTKPLIVDSPDPEPREPDETPQYETVTFRATYFYRVLVVFAFASGILVGYFAWGRTPPATQQTTAAVVGAAPTAGPVAPAPIDTTPTPQYVRYTIPTAGFPSLGPADAPITIVEFGDFQCPFCRQWEQDTYQPLLAAYPGKIRIVYRDFPLTSIHPNAMPAAEAAQCANAQGAFWPFHDKLFSSDTLDDATYKQYAQQLNLDMTRFNTCLADHTYDKYIQDNSDFAVKTGVNSTPTFFINGLAVIGAQPIDVFKQIIDKELAHEIP